MMAGRPLMFAAEHSDVEAVTALLEAGANVNARSAFGWTALMSAALYNTDPQVIARLVEAGGQRQCNGGRRLDASDSRDVQ